MDCSIIERYFTMSKVFIPFIQKENAMSLINRVGSFLLGSSIKGDTGDKHTDTTAHQLYEQGVMLLAIQENYKEALKYFKKASSLGHISAKYNQALMLFNGLGDYPDFDTAKKLFIEARNAGHTRCDEYIHFMNDIDETMLNGDPNTSSFRDLFAKNMKQAFIKIMMDSKKQVGEVVYLVSRDVIRRIGSDKVLAKEFITNELGAMHLGNDVSIQYLQDIGEYNEEIGWGNFENNFNSITTFLDHTVWPAIIRSSSNTLNFEDLVYARCCIVNEVIKYFSDVNK